MSAGEKGRGRLDLSMLMARYSQLERFMVVDKSNQPVGYRWRDVQALREMVMVLFQEHYDLKVH